MLKPHLLGTTAPLAIHLDRSADISQEKRETCLYRVVRTHEGKKMRHIPPGIGNKTKCAHLEKSEADVWLSD